jgi:hypothetical protein
MVCSGVAEGAMDTERRGRDEHDGGEAPAARPARSSPRLAGLAEAASAPGAERGKEAPAAPTPKPDPKIRAAPVRGKAGRGGPKSAAKAAARRAIERRAGGRVAVTQANPLALSRQEMGLLTKRLLVLALSDITRDDHDLEPIRITAWEYAQIFNIRGKSIYNRIEDSARELLEQTVQVKEPNGDWIMFQWVSEARYDSGRDSKDKLACIELKIHDKLKPYLLQLRRDFSIIPTDQLLSFESFNSMRLFEVLYTASYGGRSATSSSTSTTSSSGWASTASTSASRTSCTSSIARSDEFRRYTSLTFSYEGRKVGRKYQHVAILIEKNDVFQPRVRLPDSIARRVKREGDGEAKLRALQASDALRELGWSLDPTPACGSSAPSGSSTSCATPARWSARRPRRATDRQPRRLRPQPAAAGDRTAAAEVEPVDARLTREALRGIVAGLQEGFHQQRRERARAAWQG